MKNVRWTDNICTVGDTCIHGYFNHADLLQLLELCPSGVFMPTFFRPEIGMNEGQSLADKVKELGEQEVKRNAYMPLHTSEWGYYFTFVERDGQVLLAWLKERYPMVRNERCF